MGRREMLGRVLQEADPGKPMNIGDEPEKVVGLVFIHLIKGRHDFSATGSDFLLIPAFAGVVIVGVKFISHILDGRWLQTKLLPYIVKSLSVSAVTKPRQPIIIELGKVKSHNESHLILWFHQVTLRVT